MIDRRKRKLHEADRPGPSAAEGSASRTSRRFPVEVGRPTREGDQHYDWRSQLAGRAERLKRSRPRPHRDSSCDGGHPVRYAASRESTQRPKRLYLNVFLGPEGFSPCAALSGECRGPQPGPRKKIKNDSSSTRAIKPETRVCAQPSANLRNAALGGHAFYLIVRHDSVFF